MENNNNIDTSINNEGTGTDQRTFTQEDVNRIVQERLAKEKSKGNEDLERRIKELDARERRMNAIDELRKNELPDYLVDALNMNTDEDFRKSMEAIKRLKGQTSNADTQVIIGYGNPIGTVGKGGGSDLRSVFGLEG